MRPVTMFTLVMLLMLSGTAAMAQLCPSATCTPPCASPCPAPCPSTCAPCPCPTTCTPCPEPCPPACSIPAQFGCGPVPKVCNIACASDFDKSYIQAMYQQHADIIGLATMGVENATDKDLRNLAIKIQNERLQENSKLAKFAVKAGLTCTPLTLDYNEVTFYRNQLMCLSGQDFNVRWANLMMGLLQQSQQAGQMAATQASMPDLRNQGSIVAKASANEISALQKWMTRNNVPESAITGPCNPVAIPSCVPTVSSTTTCTTTPTCPTTTTPSE